jgi:hypothetical protein
MLALGESLSQENIGVGSRVFYSDEKKNRHGSTSFLLPSVKQTQNKPK